jgi:curli biogenesis system outer membrane secretion channel CsgG
MHSYINQTCKEVAMVSSGKIKVLSVVCSLALLLGACLLNGCVSPSESGYAKTEVTHTQGVSVEQAQAVRYDGPQARITVGDFQVKAAKAPGEIGDGLREMLVTSLFNTNHFIVLERQAIKDILLEQDLGASGRVIGETAAPTGKLEGAELMVYGVVSEFEMDASGSGISLGISSLPFNIGAGSKNCHMAIDLRVVDTSPGRIVFAARSKGQASDYNIKLGANIKAGNTRMPVSLGSFKNTPMEKAIRACIDRSVEYLVTKTPPKYYRH